MRHILTLLILLLGLQLSCKSKLNLSKNRSNSAPLPATVTEQVDAGKSAEVKTKEGSVVIPEGTFKEPVKVTIEPGEAPKELEDKNPLETLEVSVTKLDGSPVESSDVTTDVVVTLIIDNVIDRTKIQVVKSIDDAVVEVISNSELTITQNPDLTLSVSTTTTDLNATYTAIYPDAPLVVGGANTPCRR